MCSGETSATATTVELVADIAALAAQLAARPAPESGAACYEQAEELGRAVDVLESAIADRVAIATRTGQVAEWGHTSPAAWLRTTLGMRHARAAERAALAAQLPRLPQVTKRLAAGDLSAGYATAIATGVGRLDDADCGKAEDLLLGFVDEGHSVGQITRFAEKIKDLIAERDGTGVAPEDARRAERQWLAVHRSGTGAFVKGHFGAELVALIKAKLEPLARPCGPEDTRDHAERLADALHTHLSNGDSRWDPILVIDLKHPVWNPRTGNAAPARASAEAGPVPAAISSDAAAGDKVGRTWIGRDEALPAENPLDYRESAAASGSGSQLDPRPPVSVRTRLQRADRQDSPGRREVETEPEMTGPEMAEPGVFRPPSPNWPSDGTPFTARLADGTAISTERARAILLNAGFSTLVLGADGHPLYLGRRVRCATPAQRRALLARYSTCVVDGCEIPATGCQVDHVDGWENGQASDIDQLVMCCAFHNKYKWRHPDRIAISQRDDGRYRYQITRSAHGRQRDHSSGRPSSGRDP